MDWAEAGKQAVLNALIEAGDAGLPMAGLAAVLPAGAQQKADAGRFVKALADAGLVQKNPAGRGFVATPAGALRRAPVVWPVDPKANGNGNGSNGNGSNGHNGLNPDGTVAHRRHGPEARPIGSEFGIVAQLPEAPPDAAPPPPTGIAKAKARQITAVHELADQIAESGFMDNATPEEKHRVRTLLAVHGISDWRLWLPTMFPKLFTAGFAPHHEEFWQWVWEIEANKPKTPFVAVWNRGGAKSVSAEAAVVALAARNIRKYALYVSGTQALADEHVGNIGSMLESPDLAAAYPALSSREVGKYGESKGWRRNRLRTAAGFTVDALGLDVAARGARIEEQRPDLIVLDDVDSDNDTPATTEKKIRAITRKLLPAGSPDVVVMFVQNMIHSQSIAARLARMPSAPKADYLARRTVSGPVPAVHDLTWRAVDDYYEITGGTPSWQGMPLDACQHMLDLYGLTAFLVECQHVEADLSGGMFDHLSFDVELSPGVPNPRMVQESEIPRLLHIGCWVDPAVSSTDRSDSCGLVIDGLGADRRYYRLWSWERVSTPLAAIKTAIRVAMEMGAQYHPESLTVGIETDQGGDTWESVWREALRELLDEDPELIENCPMLPRYEYAKAGSTQLSKAERAGRMLADYEMGRFRHVIGRCNALEAGLHRFPRYKPYDCVDACLVAGTLIETVDGQVPIESVQVGDEVMTRSGWRKVTNAGPTAWDVPTVEVVSESGHRVRCTPDHRIWTDGGWVPAALSAGSMVSIGSCSPNLQSQLSTTTACTAATPRAGTEATGSTTAQPAPAKETSSHSTARFTSTTSAPSPMAASSTTPTSTRSTTPPATSSPSPILNTGSNTETTGPTGAPCSPTSPRFALSPPHGIEAPRAWHGTPLPAPDHGKGDNPSPSCVGSAEGPSIRLSARAGSAPNGAVTGDSSPTPATRSNGSANSASNPSSLSAAKPPGFVPSRVVTVLPAGVASVVYDIEVEGEHEFFAGGILVHNSYWSWRWLAELGGDRGQRKGVQVRARRGTVPEMSTSNI